MQKQNISRRGFVKSAVVAGAALGVPSIVPSSVFGAAAPSNRINVGQIGCGLISSTHWGYLSKMEDVRVVAVSDAYKSRRDALAARANTHYGGGSIATAHADFREILANEDVDAVIIGTHDNWHTPMSIAAAKAGKDVFCQKPLALDLTRTGLLRKVVRRYGSVFQFGTQYRSIGKFRKMVELVRNGYIGELKQIDAWSPNLHHYAAAYHVKPYGSTVEIPVPADLDFDAWQGPSPMVPYTADRCTNFGGYHCPETSLGFLAGYAIHSLGIAQWGNKSDDTSPIRYEGTGNVPNKGIFRTLERWDMTCDYENGVKLHLMDDQTAKDVVTKCKPGWDARKANEGVVFHGTNGWIGLFYDGFFASDNRLWDVTLKPGEERLPVSVEHNRNFIDCVKSREEPICPVEMAIRCDTICHLTNVAARTGRVINWDPEKEEIVGDPQAAKMLSLPYREKWKVW